MTPRPANACHVMGVFEGQQPCVNNLVAVPLRRRGSALARQKYQPRAPWPVYAAAELARRGAGASSMGGPTAACFAAMHRGGTYLKPKRLRQCSWPAQTTAHCSQNGHARSQCTACFGDVAEPFEVMFAHAADPSTFTRLCDCTLTAGSPREQSIHAESRTCSVSSSSACDVLTSV